MKTKYDKTNETLEGCEAAHEAYFAEESLEPPTAENSSQDRVGGCIPADSDRPSAGGSIPAGQTGGCIPAGIPVDGGGSSSVNKRIGEMSREEFEASGLTFNRDGEFAKKDASGRLRRVDEYGNIDVGRRASDRPDSTPPAEWHKM